MEVSLSTILLKQLEPILTECFGYKRRMLEEELRDTFYKHYCNNADLPVICKYIFGVFRKN